MIESDVCVVGGGLAGLSAALMAAENGLKVIVLERDEAEDYLCNSRMTGGAFHICLTDILSDESVLEQKILGATEGSVNPALARAMAVDTKRAVRWLQSHGIRFIKGGAEAHHNFVLSPPSLQRVGSDWKGRGGDVLLRTLGAELAKFGGAILRGHRATELVVENGRCVGLRGSRGDDAFEVRAATVVIADGGYQCDPAILREGISPAPEKLLQRNAKSGHGDGLRMARAAGAQLTELVGFYGHVMNRDALTNDKLWPLPWMDNIATSAIVVDRQGKRFLDEGRGGVYIANGIAAMEDPLSATVIFDQPLWDGPGSSRFLPPNPHMEKCGGTIVRAATLGELAQRLGLPAETLMETVAGYNAAIGSGGLESLDPPRSAHAYRPYAINTGPFYAVPVCAGITYTMGGIAIDEWGRAMRGDGSVFPGLYAAGGSTGGLEGGRSVGYLGGLAKAATTGMRAGQHIAHQRKNQAVGADAA
ncbi:hypothetical protein CAL12_20815 [Bordetella genomosp. 8]|uniref:FAD-dependent oxidoreductase 2 FAD-binding domain-containing protein n=1 Tax=Bordetella genomosp. 8 TaxID=1416806 RepID=A0A1W6YPH8_9BORD|nr:FAD-dependent oxidoreductase [Bordetella genomosp. 8]ARP83016.1 hypothetical protein CAL12_20815 [Bordetella genomosp. 8]